MGASVTSGVTPAGHRSAGAPPRGVAGDDLAGRRLPPRPRDGAQCRRRLPLDHHLDVVNGRVRLAGGVDAIGLVGPVGGQVPAADGQVQPARERDLVVDHHDLLVVRRPQRVGAVQAE